MTDDDMRQPWRDQPPTSGEVLGLIALVAFLLFLLPMLGFLTEQPTN